jgi:hypothetical protein
VNATIRVATPSVLSARVRQRRVAGVDSATWVDLGRKAFEAQEWRYAAKHGGTVSNSYKYRATTETVLAVASPEGHVVLWYGSQSANKATHTFGGDMFDGRVTDAARIEACKRDLQRRHADAMRSGCQTRDYLLPIVVTVGSELHVGLEAAFAYLARVYA